jgi:hypothetical protein
VSAAGVFSKASPFLFFAGRSIFAGGLCHSTSTQVLADCEFFWNGIVSKLRLNFHLVFSTLGRKTCLSSYQN